MTENVIVQMPCPGCGSPLQVLPAFVTWCSSCDWNVDPSPRPKQKWWDRHFSQASARTSQKLFEQLVASGAERPPRGSVALNLVAICVHLLTAATFAIGVLLLIAGFGLPLLVRVLLGTVAVAVAFVVQPFWQRRKKPKSKSLTKAQAPTLFELVDQIASVLGCRGVDGIRISTDYNASMGHSRAEGWVMTIGLALWSTLTDQQRVALIGHELSHQLNHDQRKSMLVAGAATSMAQWAYLLKPSGHITPLRGLPALAEPIVMVLMLPLSGSAAALAWLLHVLGSRQGLAAEYYADALSAHVAGTDAAAASLERLLLGEICLRHLVHTAKFNRTADPWRELAGYAEQVPARELERQRRLGRLRLPAIDATHPPTQLRADLVRRLPYRTAAVTLDNGHAAAIDRELAGVVNAATDLLRQRYPG